MKKGLLWVVFWLLWWLCTAQDQLVTDIWAKYYYPTPKWYLEKMAHKISISYPISTKANLPTCLWDFTKARMSLSVRYFSGAAIKAFDIRVKNIPTNAKQRLKRSIWCSKQTTECSPVMGINGVFAMLPGTGERQRFPALLRGPFKISVSLYHCNAHEWIIVAIKGA